MKIIAIAFVVIALAASASAQEAPPTEALLGEWERLYLDDEGNYRRFFPVMFAPETLR
ncbi:MAG: hypothetical protein GF419_12880, partial [Ignavibacteriales bacterium]|nr:hypothetical protein [Ignavibacteriales bacterium]